MRPHPINSMRNLRAIVLIGLLAFAPSVVADARQEARRHFRRGMDLIGSGQYGPGIRELEAAYAIKPHPSVLYNIARAYLDTGRVADAVATYKRYLETDPPDRESVAATVAQLESSTPAAPAPAPPPPPPPARGLGDAGSEAQTRLARLLERLETAIVRAESAAVPRREEILEPKAPVESTLDREARTVAPIEGEEVGTYEEVTVTASKRAQTVVEAPVATTLITEEEIRLSGARSIPELLRRVPSADLMMMGVGSANVSMRGFNQRLANKLLVLVDGRSVYQDFLGFTLWPMLPISLEDIERIEIIRGPGSTLYGANAFLGVMNIITKPAGAGARATWTLSGGQGESANTVFTASGREGAFRYRVGGSYQQADKWSLDFDASRRDITPRMEDPSLGMRTIKGWGVADVDLGQKRRLTLSGGAAQLNGEIYPIGLLRNFFFDGAQGYAKADFTAGPFKLKSFWDHMAAHAGPQYWPRDVRTIETDVETDTYDVEVQLDRDVELLGQHHLVAGLGYRFKRADWDYLSQVVQEHHFSGFVQEEWTLLRQFRLIGSYRIDRHPLLDNGKPGFAHSPRGTLLWLITPTQSLHGSVSTAFRVPTILESYVDVRLPLPGVDGGEVRSHGSRNLQPERIFNTELGYTAELDRATVDVAAYRYLVQNLIILSTLSPPAAPSYDPETDSHLLGKYNFFNEDPIYTALGAETGIKASPFERADVRFNAAYEMVSSDGDDTRCGPCLQVPRIKLFVGASYRAPGNVDFSADASYVGTTKFVEREPSRADPTHEDLGINPLDDYIAANARVAYRFLDDKMELSVVGTNLAVAHKEHPFGNLIDRRVYFSLGGAL